MRCCLSASPEAGTGTREAPASSLSVSLMRMLTYASRRCATVLRSAGTPFGLQDLQPLEAGGTIPLPLTISSRRTNLIGCFIADFGVPSIGIFDATLRRVSQGRGCARTGALRGGDDSG